MRSILGGNDVPRYAHPITDLLSPQDLRRLYDGARDPRDKALVCFFGIMGPRPGELLAVHKKDIMLEKDEITGEEFVHFILPTEKLKADGTKFVTTSRHLKVLRPTGLQMNPYIETILTYVANVRDPDDLLFDYGLSWVEKRINKLGRAVLGKQICPYHFRHSGVTGEASKGRTLDQLMHYKGSKDVRSVVPYVHASPYDIRAGAVQYAPQVCKTCGRPAPALFSNGECEACVLKPYLHAPPPPPS